MIDWSKKKTNRILRCNCNFIHVYFKGVRQTELLFGKAVVQVLLVTGQNILLLALAYGIFAMPFKGSWWLTITFIGIAEIQGMIYGRFYLYNLNKNTGVIICQL